MLNPDEVLEGLTVPQREAAAHVDGPLLVLAGAGSGKTRTITRRIAYMVACGIPAGSILAITFTNKAAGEMRERVGSLLGGAVGGGYGRGAGRGPTVCTFHALCARLLREFADQAPGGALPRGFTIFDSSDQLKAVKQAIKDVNVSTDNFTPAQVLGTISKAKNKLQSPAAYAQAAGGFFEKNVGRIYARYEAILLENKAVDFDDLLLKVAVLLRDNKEVREQLQERYQYILIDEYQDTNHAQFILAHMLAMNHKNICATGDPDQSIYGWRGANIGNILEFEQFYPNAKVVLLEQNYRSTKVILQAASALIAHNQRRKKKELWTENEVGPKIELIKCRDEHQEAAEVVKRIKALHEKSEGGGAGAGGVSWDKMAVFYRVNSLSRVLEDALMKLGIPYQIARGTEFYGRKEIKDVLAYLRVIANPSDNVSLERIANVPARGLGETSLVRIAAYASERGMSLLGAFGEAEQIPDLTGRAANAARKVAGLFEQWSGRGTRNAHGETRDEGEAGGMRNEEGGMRKQVEADPLFDAELAGGATEAAGAVVGSIRALMERVVKESGLEEELKKADAGEDTGEGRLANVGELISVAAEFDAQHEGDATGGGLGEYLEQVTLVSDVDRLKDNGGAVTLMTLHAAKGLEFPFVAMVGMEDGLIPHARALDFAKPDEMEEERRLAFVGITRAMKHLVLTHARYRMIRGQTERTIASQFLSEMPDECFAVVDLTAEEGAGSLGYRDEVRFGGRGGGGGAGGGWGRSGRGSRDDFGEAPRAAGGGSAAGAGGAGGFKRGMLVRHGKFGLGRVEDLSPAGSDTRIVVLFQGGAGRKTLLLGVARLERVDA